MAANSLLAVFTDKLEAYKRVRAAGAMSEEEYKHKCDKALLDYELEAASYAEAVIESAKRGRTAQSDDSAATDFFTMRSAIEADPYKKQLFHYRRRREAMENSYGTTEEEHKAAIARIQKEFVSRGENGQLTKMQAFVVTSIVNPILGESAEAYLFYLVYAMLHCVDQADLFQWHNWMIFDTLDPGAQSEYGPLLHKLDAPLFHNTVLPGYNRKILSALRDEAHSFEGGAYPKKPTDQLFRRLEGGAEGWYMPIVNEGGEYAGLQVDGRAFIQFAQSIKTEFDNVYGRQGQASQEVLALKEQVQKLSTELKTAGGTKGMSVDVRLLGQIFKLVGKQRRALRGGGSSQYAPHGLMSLWPYFTDAEDADPPENRLVLRQTSHDDTAGPTRNSRQPQGK